MTPARTRPFITVVSGLPRSGTSMLMQMLEAGGMPVLSDGARSPDPDNPKGYLEYEPVKALPKNAAWLAQAVGAPGDPPRFVGVRFNLSGNTHYGWIELQLNAPFADGTILGYAYESTPDTGLFTVSSIPEPPSLLLLASGAAGLAALRRRRQPADA